MTSEKSKSYVIGADDAGRGPVIGPMLLCGVLVEKEKEVELKKIGAKDSKLLSPSQREGLIDGIKNIIVDWKTQIITPAEIDTGMGIGLNLNQVEAFACANIINELVKNLDKDQRENTRIILDCPSINTEGWKKQLLEYIKDKKMNIVCEHKADFNHPSVSAASIIAKTTRDAEIEKIKKQIGIDFGSGYPSDPYTKAFLKGHALDFKKERIFRESWSTWRTAAGITGKKEKEEKSKQARLFE